MHGTLVLLLALAIATFAPSFYGAPKRNHCPKGYKNWTRPEGRSILRAMPTCSNMSRICAPAHGRRVFWSGILQSTVTRANASSMPACFSSGRSANETHVLGGGINVTVVHNGPSVNSPRQGILGNTTVYSSFSGSNTKPWESTVGLVSTLYNSSMDNVMYNVTIQCVGADANDTCRNVYYNPPLSVTLCGTCANSTHVALLLFDACITYSTRAAKSIHREYGPKPRSLPLTRACT